MIELVLFMAIATAKVSDESEFLAFIGEQAQAIWGSNWRADLTRAYVQILQDEGDSSATYESRRRHVYRIFERAECSLNDALRLVRATRSQVQLLGERG